MEGVVYEATITQVPSGHKETYTGVTARSFKARFYEHNTDMRKVKSRTKSNLSYHVWDLNDSGINFEVSWKIKERSSAYNSTTKSAESASKKNYTFYIKEKVPL